MSLTPTPDITKKRLPIFPDWVHSALPRPVDALLFVAVALAAAIEFLPYGGYSVFFVGAAVPMLWRRRNPDLVALAIIPAHLIQLFYAYGPSPANVVVPIMLYTVAAYGRERFRDAWLFIGIGAAILASICWGLSGVGDLRSIVTQTMPAAVMLVSLVAASWAIGTVVRTRVLVRTTEMRAFQVEQQQHEQAIELAATQERQRLAREMHDVVAHSLAVIVVQADGGSYAATMDGDPEKRLATAAQALQTIRTTAQESLVETRRLVGVLREGQCPELTPAASLTDLQGLVDGLTVAGRDVRLEVSGDIDLRRLLSPAMELAVFRIVQEALTNAVKHAGDEAAVRIRIHHAPAGISIQIRDNGRGATTSDGLGHGLVGMRERVAAFGGSLNARNHITGGFVIEAFLPTVEGAEV